MIEMSISEKEKDKNPYRKIQSEIKYGRGFEIDSKRDCVSRTVVKMSDSKYAKRATRKIYIEPE